MSNLVLYRKYRPQKFSEVVGQEHITNILENAIKSEKIAHAYLFCGPKGSGKTTVARILAKAVNCEKREGSEPCNKCSSCLEIMGNKAMDIIEIDAASHRGIDEIRELREGIRFAPAKSKYKVFILDEAHQLTSGAGNALLKMLEDAPEHVIFILATTEPQKMIPTVISRCQRFNFRKIGSKETIDLLKKIAKKEGVSIDNEVFPMIASFAGGSLRDAEGLLSQIVSLSLENTTVKKEDVGVLLGIVEREVVGDFVSSFLEDNSVASFQIINSVVDQGINIESFYGSIMRYLREMMILKIISKTETENSKTLIENLLDTLTKEELERIKEQSEGVEVDLIKKIIDIFYEAGERIKYSPIPQLPIEVSVAEILEEVRKRKSL